MAARNDAGRPAEATEKSGPQVPALGEWLQSYSKLEAALREAYLRFVVTIDYICLSQEDRVCFELQEAFWFYIDYCWEASKRELPKLNHLNFVHLMLELSPELQLIYQSPKDRQRLFQAVEEHSMPLPVFVVQKPV